MPFEYRWDPERNRVVSTLSGLVTLPELRRHLELESRDGLFHRPEIVDASEAQFQLCAEEVRSAVEIVRSFVRDQDMGPTAIVVKGDFAYGMMRMLEMLIGDLCDLRPFRSFEEAEAWLAQAQVRPRTTKDSG